MIETITLLYASLAGGTTLEDQGGPRNDERGHKRRSHDDGRAPAPCFRQQQHAKKDAGGGWPAQPLLENVRKRAGTPMSPAIETAQPRPLDRPERPPAQEPRPTISGAASAINLAEQPDVEESERSKSRVRFGLQRSPVHRRGKRLDEVDQAPQGDRNPSAINSTDEPPCVGRARKEQEPHRDRLDDAVEQDGRTSLDVGRPEVERPASNNNATVAPRSHLQVSRCRQPADRRPAGIDFVLASRLGSNTRVRLYPTWWGAEASRPSEPARRRCKST